MKKFVKGFTLVELIVVMAVFTILMTAIMQCFKPIRETYVDSTLYESQRTAQNGVVKYVSESVRYATDLGMYTGVDASAALTKFADAYVEANKANPNNPIPDADANTVKAKVKQKAEIIVIDNSKPYTFGGEDYYGRVLRRKLDGTSDIKTRLALGDAYYGKSDYSVTFHVECDGSGKSLPSEGIKINVASKGKYGVRENQKGSDPFSASGKIVSVSGLVLCQNLKLDYSTFDAGTSSFNEGVSSAKGNVTYIIYLNDKVH